MNRRHPLHVAVRDSHEVTRALQERVKELNCLYGIAQLVDRHGNALEPLLTGIVALLPPGWQYPEICCARLTLRDRQYLSAAFRESPWRQTARVVSAGEPIGAVEVLYTRQMPELDEGPFLTEERALIEAVAERVARIVERVETERRLHDTLRQLQVERTALREANAALHAVLDRIEEEKRAVRDSVVANVDKILMPVLHALEVEIPAPQKPYVDMLRENLEDIVSPFADALSKAFTQLTAVELRICGLIRNGHTTKEIARLRRVSPATVSRQRERIRKKLQIAGTDTNLTTFLTTFLPDS